MNIGYYFINKQENQSIMVVFKRKIQTYKSDKGDYI